jgi:hypothetical protein
MIHHLPLTLALLASGAARPQDPGNVRVVDAATGAPVVGAEVLGVREAEIPVFGITWSEARDVTDAEGWATLPPVSAKREYQWLIVRAEGYGVAGQMDVPRPDGWVVEPVALHPEVPAGVRVLDYLGRPVEGLHLGLCVGCGHTPDMASAMTDSSGRATLPGVGREIDGIADVYPVGDGVLTDYLYVDWDAARGGVYETVAEPGGTLEGRLLHADGSPAVAHGVGVPERHRGPWTVTDEEGRFRCQGLKPRFASYLQVKAPTGETIAGFEGSRIGVERTLRLPAEFWGDTEPARDAELALSLYLEDWPGHDGATYWPLGVPVLATHLGTGWCAQFHVALAEETVLELPSGPYRIEIGGGASPYPLKRVEWIELSPGLETPEVELEVPRPKLVRLEVDGVSEGSKLEMVCADGQVRKVKLDRVQRSPGAARGLGVVERVALPAEPFGLWLDGEDEPDAADRSAVLMELSEPRHRKDADEGAVLFVRATRRPR